MRPCTTLLGLTRRQLSLASYTQPLRARTSPPQAPPTSRIPLRPFSATASLPGKKQDKKAAAAPPAEEEIDPLDLSSLQDGIRNALDRLKDDLSKLRAGGRFNPETIEAVRVHLTKGSKETVKLGDVAQVVPKGGRMTTILVAEEDVGNPNP